MFIINNTMKVFNSSLKETYHIDKLKNGLPVIFLPKKGRDKKSVFISTNYGSLDLEFKSNTDDKWINSPPGVAHFLEHQLFKKPEYNVMQKFGQLGSFYNANTGYNATSYFFVCTSSFEQNLDVLLELVFEPYFEDESVAKEEKIIEQELKMYLDMPDMKIIKNLFENIYHVHPIRIDIGGTVESIKEINKDVLWQCYNTFYHPHNMVVAVSGDLDKGKVIAQLEKYFKKAGKKKKTDTKHIISRKVTKEPESINNFKTDVIAEVARPRIIIGYKDKKVGLKGNDLLFHSLASDIMLDCILGRSSELYNRLYNDSLIDGGFSASYESHPTYAMVLLGGETEKPDELYEKLISGIKKAKKDRIKKNDLMRIKRKYLGEFISMFDSPENVSMMFARNHFKDIKPFDIPKYLKRVLLKDVSEKLNTILDEKFHSVSILRSPKG